jgi:hypothetical protein
MPGVLRAATSPYPALSEGNEEHYFSIYSHRSVTVLKNNGVDSVITSVDYPWDSTFSQAPENVKWKFVRVGAYANRDSSELDTFKIVSKVGGQELLYLEYAPKAYQADWVDNAGYKEYSKNGNEYVEATTGMGDYVQLNRFVAAEAGKGNTFVFKRFNSEALIFQLQCIEKKSFLNMTNNTAWRPGSICIYGVNNDGGNPFSAVTGMNDFAEVYKGSPSLSTSSEPKWYGLLFLRTGKAVTSDGVNKRIVQQSLKDSNNDDQFFRLEGDYVKGFKVISKIDGMELKHDGDGSLQATEGGYTPASNRIILVAAGMGDLFSFASTASTTAWQLKHSGGQFVNETVGTACLYGANRDGGNSIEFVEEGFDPYAGAPTLSNAADPKWYYVKNSRNNNAIMHGGEGQIYTVALAEGGVKQDSQLFRFEGSYADGVKIISKVDGGALYYNRDSNRYYVRQDTGTIFKINPTSNFTYGDEDRWTLQNDYLSTATIRTDYGLNVDNSNMVSCYQLSDNGNVLEFIHVSRYFSVTVANPEKGSVNKGTGLYVDSSEVNVVATPKPYNRVSKWVVNGVEIPATSDTLPLKLDRNITLTVTFIGNDTLLQSLSVEGVTAVLPAFDPSVSSYTAYVPYGAQSVTIAAAARSADATAAGAGVKALASDSVVFPITVTAEDGSVKVYSVSVLRAAQGASSDVSLTLSLNGGADTTVAGDAITFTVAGSVDSVALAATVAAGAVAYGDLETPLPLSAPDSADATFGVSVLAADYDSIKRYTVTVHRRSANAYLSALTLTAGGDNLLPSFAPDVVSYTIDVPKSVTAITVAAVPASSYATVTGDVGSQSLADKSTFSITVTSEEGAAYTYTVTVNVVVSGDATLSSLTVSAGALTPDFSPSQTAYTVSVGNSVGSITLTATAAHDSATVSGDGVKTLNVGENPFTITVTAEDGSAQAYTVTVTRAAAATAVETVAASALRLYPNPVANGELKIENGELRAGEKILIYGLSGVLAATYEVAAGAVTVINVSQLPQGVYVVKAGAYAAKATVY